MHLLARPADRGRRSDDLGPHAPPVEVPRAQLIHRGLVQPDQGAEGAADQVQLVLDDQVRRAQGADGLRSDRGEGAALGMAVAVLDLGRTEAVAGAEAVHPAEEHGGGALPGHLRELVHRGDQQAGQAAVDLLIDYHGGDAFAR